MPWPLGFLKNVEFSYLCRELTRAKPSVPKRRPNLWPNSWPTEFLLFMVSLSWFWFLLGIEVRENSYECLYWKLSALLNSLFLTYKCSWLSMFLCFESLYLSFNVLFLYTSSAYLVWLRPIRYSSNKDEVFRLFIAFLYVFWFPNLGVSASSYPGCGFYARTSVMLSRIRKVGGFYDTFLLTPDLYYSAMASSDKWLSHSIVFLRSDCFCILRPFIWFLVSDS